MAKRHNGMIIFLLPVFNEEKNIGSLLADISKYSKDKGWEYLICISDDGSSDSTIKIARSFEADMSLKIVSNPTNMGPGAAFDAGFKKILESASDDDIVVTMEADNTSDLISLEAMVEKAREGFDLVIASCYAKDGKVEKISIARRILSRCANLLVKLIFKQKSVNTFSSFYRCYRVGPLKRAYRRYGDNFIEEKGFTCAVDIFLKLSRLGISVAEVPSTLNCNLRVGRSKMKMIRTTEAYLRLFLREKFRKDVDLT